MDELVGLVAVIMFLGIPLAWSPVGRAIAEAVRGSGRRYSDDTGREVAALKDHVKALEAELHQIREAIVLNPSDKALTAPRAPQSVKLQDTAKDVEVAGETHPRSMLMG